MKKVLMILVIGVLTLSTLLTMPAKASSLAEQLSGRILLQVEENGEAWYVNPSDSLRYFMGRPTDAFDLMRSLGVGITNENLTKILVAEANFSGLDTDGDGLSDAIEQGFGTNINLTDTDADGFSDKDEILSGFSPLNSSKNSIVNNSFSNNQKGKIFLQVESFGEAWYVNPVDNKRYYLGRPADAFNVMRSLGLGITNTDLEKIEREYDSAPIGDDSDLVCPLMQRLCADGSDATDVPGTCNQACPEDPTYECKTEACFELFFLKCYPASYTAVVEGFASYYYEIIGPEAGLCKMKTLYTVNPNPNWENQPMDCRYDNTKSLEDANTEVFTDLWVNKNIGSCSGSLSEILTQE